MKKLNKASLNIGVKTYSLIKYLASLAGMFFLVNPLVNLLVILGTVKVLALSPSDGEMVNWILWSLGFFFLMIYLIIRLYFFFMTKYEHNQKEKKQFFAALGFYLIVLSLSLIYAVMTSLYHHGYFVQQSNFLIIWGSMTIVLVLVFNILGSIFESFSRVGEQQFFINEQALRQDGASFSENGVARTEQAQKILETQKNKASSITKMSDKDVLDQFFEDEKKDN